eukprot:403653-Rhodomonas_salina.1
MPGTGPAHVATSLRACYAMSSPDIPHAYISLRATRCLYCATGLPTCYAMSGTDLATRYAKSGTDVAYQATNASLQSLDLSGNGISNIGSRPPIALRFRYTISGTDICYAATASRAYRVTSLLLPYVPHEIGF